MASFKPVIVASVLALFCIAVFAQFAAPPFVLNLNIIQSTGVSCPPISDFVSVWRFDNNGTDSSDSNPVTLKNSPSFLTGKFNQAISLNGTTQFTFVDDGDGGNTAPANLVISGSTVTLTALVFLNGTGSGQIIYNGRNGVVCQSFALYYGTDVSGCFTGTAQEFSFGVTTGAAHVATDTTVEAQGQWIFVAGVYDGAHVTLYTNGVQAAQVAATGTLATVANNKVSIGADGNNSYSRAFIAANLDEVTISSSALTQSQITQMASCAP